MKENTYSRNDEIEVRICDLFWSIMRHWRAIIVTMLLFGLLLGVYGVVKEYRDYTDPEARAKAEEAYLTKLEKYERSKETYETKAANLREWVAKLDYYKQNSLLLLMDPYNIYQTSVTYFIDTNYEIIPGVMYQNPNYTEALVNSYSAAVNRIPFDDLIDMPGGADLTTAHTVTKYAKKNIYSIDADLANGLMTITVIADTEERGDKVLAEVRRVMEENEQLLNTVIGEHTLSVVSEGSSRTLDLDLANLQIAFSSDYESNSTEIDDAEAQLKKLVEPEKTVPSKTTIIKQGIKLGIIGLIGGLILAAGYFFVDFYLRDRVCSPKVLQERYGVPVLGVFTSGKKRHVKGMDRACAAHLGMVDKASEEEEAAYIAAALRLRLHDAKKVLLLGTADGQKMAAICELLAGKLSGIECKLGGNPNEDAAAVEALGEECSVVCVEGWQTSANAEIADELGAVKASGNPLIGFILTR